MKNIEWWSCNAKVRCCDTWQKKRYIEITGKFWNSTIRGNLFCCWWQQHRYMRKSSPLNVRFLIIFSVNSKQTQESIKPDNKAFTISIFTRKYTRFVMLCCRDWERGMSHLPYLPLRNDHTLCPGEERKVTVYGREEMEETRDGTGNQS